MKHSFLHNQFSCLLLLAFLFLTHFAAANNGWDEIKVNDFVTAKQTFQTALEQNPNDKEALYGLIFIAELTEDDDSYQRYITALINQNWDEYEYLLFGHVFEGLKRPEDLLTKNLSNRAKASVYFEIADSLFYNREKSGAFKVLRDFIGDYNWSIVGPFKNVAGSGHIKEYSIETDAYDTTKIYTNHADSELKWTEIKLRYPDGKVNFSLLPSTDYRSSNVFYANTFLSIPADRTIQLRIARSSPMKIWLDGDLVFDNNNNIDKNWDSEIVELAIKKGAHRLLVKISEFPDGYDAGTFNLYYHENSFSRGESRYNYGSNGHNRYDNSESFALRITDTNGKVQSDIVSDFEGKFSVANYKTKLTQKTVINHFQNRLNQNPENWSNYYLLCKAYMKFDNSEDGEELFVSYLKSKEKSVYFNYLMAKMYTSNGKSERGEKLISILDKSKTPIYKILYKEFQKLDEKDDEAEYLAALYELLQVSPSNLNITHSIIDFYTTKGKLEEKRQFIQSFIQSFPKYEEGLEPYLEDDSYQPSSYKPMTDKEKEKNYKKILKGLRDTYSAYSYNIVIRYLKNQEKEKVDKILEYYSKIISMEPYRLSYLKEKGDYLFEKERYNEALSAYEQVLQFSPYDGDSYETIGNIYHEKKDKEKALIYYKKAKALSGGGSSGYGSSLDEKIEKIEEPQKFDDLFDTPIFEAALKDDTWKAELSGEESVILLHTVEAQLDEENKLKIDQKVLIKILTDAGAKAWTEANFNMFGRMNYVRVIKSDGREITPDRSGSYVVFKNLEANDLIQLEGTYSSNISGELGKELFFTLPLNHDAIIYKSKVELMVPEGKILQFRCNRVNCDHTKRTERGKDIYTWNNSEVEKFENESAVLDNYDMYAWIMMSSLEDWTVISDWYLDKTYRRLEPNYEVRTIADSIVTAGMTDKEKVVTIYNYITKEINYSFVSFLNSNFIPKRPGSTCSAKIGDCKDVASLMISMLRHVGIESYYVLVKIRNFTAHQPVPSMWFDHVIVGYVLNGKMQYMDLTTDFYPYYAVHEGDSDAWALLIKKGSNNAFHLPNDHLNPNKSLFDVEIEAKFGLDRSVELEVKTESTGVVGGYLRERLHGMTETECRRFISQNLGESVFENLKIVDYKFGELEEITESLESEFLFKSDKYLDKISRFYVFEIPYIKATDRFSELLTEKRYNNLDLHQIMDIYPSIQVVNIEMPDGYRLSEVPKSIVMDNVFFDYEVRYEQTPKGMKVYRKLNFKNRLVKVEDYVEFKKSFLEMVEADGLKLAMEK